MSKPSPPTTIGDYTIGPEIGKGSFANVYKGYNRKNNQPVAVKSVFRAKLDNKKLLDNLEIEISILRTLQHPHIVALLDYKKTPDHFHLFMDYCSLGDLSYFIRKRDQLVKTHPIISSVLQRYPSPPDSLGLNQVIVMNFLQQLASSLKFLRNQNLVHRDIKPQNLLLAPPLDEKTFAEKQCVGMYELPILKIADFGFARFLPATSMAETLCGSPLYMAPEILRYEKYGAKADLWSVGAVLYEMSVGKPPFRAANHVELLAKIEKNRDRVIFPQSSKVSDEMAGLIRGLLKCSPTERMGFSEFFSNELVTRNLESSHPLVDQVNQDLFISEYLPPEEVEPAKDLVASPLATKQLPKNDIIVEKDYVVVEKAAVEVNSLADEFTKTTTRKPAMRRFSSDNNSRRPSFPERRFSINRENPLTKALGAASNRLFGEAPNVPETSTASAIEKLSTKAHSIAIFAEVKYKQVAPLSSDSGDALSGAILSVLCEEGVALYVKALSLFSRSMRLAHEWWNEAAGDSPEPKLVETVEWIRLRFNECLEKAEFLKSKLLEISEPSTPAVAEKLIFDRALEISRNAALMELRREDLPNCEASYSTAIWMLEALLDVEKDGSEERLDKEDVLMVEKFIMSIGKRLSVLRGKMDKKSIS